MFTSNFNVILPTSYSTGFASQYCSDMPRPLNEYSGIYVVFRKLAFSYIFAYDHAHLAWTSYYVLICCLETASWGGGMKVETHIFYITLLRMWMGRFCLYMCRAFHRLVDSSLHVKVDDHYINDFWFLLCLLIRWAFHLLFASLYSVFSATLPYLLFLWNFQVYV